jgi:MFS family permease
MFCGECGESNPNDANFCTKCGNNLIVTEFSIEFFIKQNKDLLVCLGVFGALTIYLKQISSTACVDELSMTKTLFGDFCYVDFGVASSLIIFLCLGTAIFLRLLGIYDEGPRPFVFNVGNIVRMILIIPFGALIGSLFFFVSKSLSGPSQIIALIVTGFLGGLFFFGSINFIFSHISSRLFRWLGSVVLFIIILFLSGWALLTSNYYLSFFLSMFNTFNVLFIIGYPILIFTKKTHKPDIGVITQNVIQQIKKK